MSPTDNNNRLIIATRKSPLALWQAEHIKTLLLNAHPGLSVSFLPMSTKGDKILDTPLAKVGGKGLFVKELEVALLEGKADIAVHSMKDVPMAFPDGLMLSTIIEREEPRDAFVSNRYQQLSDLPEGAVIGTSSLRRQAQLKAWRDDLVIHDCRGNVGTRLAKLDDGEYDAIILAAAGLIRLEIPERIKHLISQELILPAAGQGAIGIEQRTADLRTKALLEPLSHQLTTICVTAERAMNAALQGGCQIPIGAKSEVNENQLTLTGLVAELDGSLVLKAEQSAQSDASTQLGIAVAKELISMGADKILAKLQIEQ